MPQVKGDNRLEIQRVAHGVLWPVVEIKVVQELDRYHVGQGIGRFFCQFFIGGFAVRFRVRLFIIHFLFFIGYLFFIDALFIYALILRMQGSAG